MTSQTIKHDLSDFIKSLPVINTHSHHLPDAEHANLDLTQVLNNSYITSRNKNILPNKDYSRDFVKVLRHNSYFYWLEKSLQEIYNIRTPLDELSWDNFNKAIIDAHSSPDHHMNILTDICNYKYIVTDPFWYPGNAQGHQDYFTPSFRIDMFLFGYSVDVADYNGNNPFSSHNLDPSLSFDEYLEKIKYIILQKKLSGCVALKSAIAYSRGLDFTQTKKFDAKKAYMNPHPTAAQIKAFQDYVFFEICSIASVLNLPFQIHTGLGCLQNTNALSLFEVISQHPNTKFSLMHGSYPYTNDICALIHEFDNVYADLSWLPLVSPSVCEIFLTQLIEIGDINRITWGCDTFTSEESYAALLAIRQILLNIFSKKTTEKYITFNQSTDYIYHILSKNAQNLYDLD